MNLKDNYYYFKGVLSPKFCDELIEYGKSQQEKIALTGRETVKLEKNTKLSKKDLKDLKKRRDSNISWLNDPWIYKEIHPYIQQANVSAGWNFQWDWSESCQFTKYKKNQFYEWHQDSYDGPYNTPQDLNFHGKIRKLSVTCSLSDPKDYKGGELEFDFRNNQNGKPVLRTCEEILPRGSIVVFSIFYLAPCKTGY
jgi:PKHD-type hydroxylase